MNVNKPFYLSGLLFLGLAAAVQLFSGILYFRLGPNWVVLPSAAEVYLRLLIVSTIPSLFLLRYYYAQKYWFTFSTYTVEVIAGLCLGVITYLVILSKEPNNYSLPVGIFALAAAMMYAISLIISRARKNVWLLAAGICLLLCLLIRTATFILEKNTHGVHVHTLAENWTKWSALAYSIPSVLLMLQFLKEARQVKGKATAVARQKNAIFLSGVACIFALGCLIIPGVALDEEGRGADNPDSPISEIAAMEARSFEAHTYVSSGGDSLPYRFLKPLDYVAGKQYPLVVCLHHGGAHGKDNIRQVDAAQPAWTLAQNYNMHKHPAFIFVPQCPPGFCWGGIPNYPSVDSLVFDAIRSLEGQYSIDVNRIYVAGISMGGYGSWHFICSHPKMFAAAIPICGAGDPALAKNAVDIPVWAFHGALDRSVPVQKDRDMIDAVKKAGGHPQYTEFPDGDHNIWNEIQTPELLDWLFAQRRANTD